jgi:hypothetical protein
MRERTHQTPEKPSLVIEKAGRSRKTRYPPSRLPTTWHLIKEPFTPPSQRSITPASGIDSSFNNINLSYSDSSVDPLTTSKHKRKLVPERVLSLRTRQKSSVANSMSRYGGEDPARVAATASSVVVHTDFALLIPAVTESDAGSKVSDSNTGPFDSNGSRITSSVDVGQKGE